MWLATVSLDLLERLHPRHLPMFGVFQLGRTVAKPECVDHLRARYSGVAEAAVTDGSGPRAVVVARSAS